MEKKSYEQIRTEIAKAKQVVKEDGIYVHYKNPDSRYEVKGFGVQEADNEICVLYSPVSMPDVVFTRPVKVWLESVDGTPRFSLINRGN